MNIMKEVLVKHSLWPAKAPRNNHYLGEDPERMKHELEQYGFTNIKMWYQPMYFPYSDFEDYYQSLGQMPNYKALFAQASEEL